MNLRRCVVLSVLLVGVDIANDMATWGITTPEEYYGLYLAPEDLTPYLPYLNP